MDWKPNDIVDNSSNSVYAKKAIVTTHIDADVLITPLEMVWIKSEKIKRQEYEANKLD